MCGIAGLFRPGGTDARTPHLLDQMSEAIAHRGPDGRDIWWDEIAGIGLAHNRLAIIDLTAAGAQPMTSADSRFVITFNGEIYNYAQLRAEISAWPDAPDWRGHSDTEVLLELIARRGLEAALPQLVGMFAFALWDRRNRTLSLVRDRAGEKPLHYGWVKGTLLFGSELKALRAHPDFRGEIDGGSVAAFTRFGYIPGTGSIYRDVYKVAPGHIVTIRDRGQVDSRPYWTPPASVPDPTRADIGQAVDELERLLSDAVALQMRSDVPMGAFLSGGVDSSTIVALMQQQSSRPVRTFSIGFSDGAFDEAPHAAAVAGYLGTDHTEFYVTANDALDVIPSLSSIYDEPFADSSQIPTFLLSRLTRQHVTVSLSGDAGDEMFGGYERYFQGQRFARNWGRTPKMVRAAMATALRRTPGPVWDIARRLAPSRLGALTSRRIPKIADALECADVYDVYRRLVSQWKDATKAAVAEEPVSLFHDQALRDGSSSFAEWMMAIDFQTYLPDDILVKVDRASMAVSLESRVPLLDHRIIDFASRLPMSAKISGGTGKRVLRELLYRHVPRDLIDRPKQGFAIPLDEWLRGPLKDWAADLLGSDDVEMAGNIRPAEVRKAWQDHIDGHADNGFPLWVSLMGAAWTRSQRQDAIPVSRPGKRAAVR